MENFSLLSAMWFSTQRIGTSAINKIGAKPKVGHAKANRIPVSEAIKKSCFFFILLHNPF